jgi:hypothetical protein
LLVAAAVVPKTASATASAELYRLDTQAYGRYEARIRFAPGSGVVGSFFLWKPGADAPGAFWNELDFEALGIDCHLQTNSIYGQPKANHEQVAAIPGGICGLYHDYRFEWTPTYIAWVVDGREIRRDTGAAATAYSQNAPGGLAFHFNIWPGDATFGGNLNPAILPVSYYISWVAYSSYTNNTFQPVWREEFDGASLPAGWAAGNWASPKNLSIHNQQNVSFVNGIAILSMTGDNALGPSVTPPPDIPAPVDGGAPDAARDASSDVITRDARNEAAGAGGAAGGAGGNAPDASGSAGANSTASGTGGTSGGAGNATTTTSTGGGTGAATTTGAGGSSGGATTSRNAPSSDAGCSCSFARRANDKAIFLAAFVLGVLSSKRRSRRTPPK